MSKRKYDFAGWVTKNDIRCSDGVTIKHDAFKANDGQKVPLVWNHDYTSPGNVLGHVLLQNEDKGVYGFGFFNETEDAKQAKELIRHGDIASMSIGARKIKRSGNNVVHGLIYEVSLVMAGANPGALIETVVQHSDEGDEEKGIIYTGTLIHSSDDILDEKGDDKMKDEVKVEDTIVHKDKTIGEVFEELTEEQQDAVYALIGMALEDAANDNKGDEDTVKQNVFNKGSVTGKDEILKHGIQDALKEAQKSKGSLKDVLAAQTIQHDGVEETLLHGINSIEMLFPEAFHSTNGNVPILYKDPNTASERILNAVHKSPFSNVKTTIADLTEEEARAKGYIKGTMKKEEYFSLIRRKTTPTTIYKKQKIDRDDMIDITDFNVVGFMNGEMQMMLKEELARAILVGDGRDIDSDDKINEEHIRPIINDHEFFTIKKAYADAKAFLEAVIIAMAEYRGSGTPSLYIDPALLSAVKLVKAQDGRYLFGDIPSDAAIAARMGVDAIVPTSFMTGKGAIIVNLKDYTLGSSKGGQITTFEDFDIDFNQHKYLIETRLSGSLTMPKSAIHLNPVTAGTGVNAEKAGLTYGERQADKTEAGE